jgi:hypothetical protein
MELHKIFYCHFFQVSEEAMTALEMPPIDSEYADIDEDKEVPIRGLGARNITKLCVEIGCITFFIFSYMNFFTI